MRRAVASVVGVGNVGLIVVAIVVGVDLGLREALQIVISEAGLHVALVLAPMQQAVEPVEVGLVAVAGCFYKSRPDRGALL